MAKWGIRKKKTRVALHATPARVYADISRSKYAKMTECKDVIQMRHTETKSWDQVCRELGGVNPGTLINVMKSNRKATNRLIQKLNNIYGSHIPPREIKVDVRPCVHCGDVHISRRCPKQARVRRYRDLFDLPTAELARRLRERG